MTQKYIDADRLKAEIEKRMHICNGVYERDSDTYYQGKAVAYQETLSLINSLQQKQSCDTCTNDKGCVTCKDGKLWEGKEQSSKDLEEAAEKCIDRALFKWSYDDEDSIEQYVYDSFIAGAEWQKAKMLKDAVERTVKIDSGGYPYIDITAELYDYEHDVPLAKEGELVKIIIVPTKED